MLLFSKPSQKMIRAYLDAQSRQDFSYPEVGRSRARAPAGYTVDQNRIQLGEGAETYERAKRAVNAWKMFNIGWLKLCGTDAPIEAGTNVAVLVSHLKFWSLNPCRIVYTLNEPGVRDIYGFAYGTLPGHSEIGEERFTVEFNTEDKSVWYDIYAFSRPRLLPRLAYPFTRALQKRFARDSMQAMLQAVG